MKSKSSLKVLSVLLSVFLIVSMIPTMVFAGNDDPIEILSQPEDITAETGEEKTMSVAAENVASYQWQRSADGATWSNIGTTNTNYRDVKTETLTIKVSKNTAAYDYRCALKNCAGTVYTDPASVTLQQLLEISQQPQNITGKSGDEKTMKVVATNASSYQWQRSSDDGETWSNISTSNVNYKDAKTSILTIKLSKNTAGFVYRCVVKNSENTVNSEAAAVTVILPVTIKTQPKNITAEAGEEKTMSVVAQNATSYQWQRSSDAGETWSNISTTNTNYRDVKTDVLTIKVSKNTAGFVYRCVVKNAEFTENTEAATVTVAAPVQLVEITVQPESIVGQLGEEKTMTVSASNATSYQWQRSADDGQTWSNISTTNTNYSNPKTKTLTVKVNKNTAGYVYRCIVKNSASSETTDIATVSASQQFEITEQPLNNAGSLGEEKTLSITATNATSYQWQRSADNGQTWSNISATNTNYSGAKTDTLTVIINKTTIEYSYRCIVQNDSGDSLTSRTAYIHTGIAITFVANGGYFHGNRSETVFNYIMWPGIKLYESDIDFGTKCMTDGYILDCWCFDAECTEEVPKTYVVSEEVTLYAKWVESVTVTWDANGGTIWGESVRIRQKAKNSNLNYKEYPDRYGYTFEGWYLDADYIEKLPDDYVYTEDVTFYAKWKKNPVVTWDANGGYIIMGDTQDPTYEEWYYTNQRIRYSRQAAREGYIFDGWYLDANCTIKVEDIWDYVVTKDVTFYAKWLKAVNVTWNGNGGYIWGDEDYPNYTSEEVKGRALNKSNSAERSGFFFEGWYLDANCTVPVESVWNYVVNEDVTFYAKWAEAVNVTWDAYGGTVYGEQTYIEPRPKDEILNSYLTPERDGYIFYGWYLDENFETKMVLGEFVATQDVTFYARWYEAVNVTWNGNGGYIWGDEDYPNYTSEEAKGRACGYSMPAERDNYVLVGWCLDQEGNNQVDIDSYVITGEVTFYAKWVEACNVTWDFNDPNQQNIIQTVARESIINWTYSPYRDGYLLEGWYLDADCTVEKPTDYVADQQNVTFYAKWVEPVYVTWNGNGGFVTGVGNNQSTTYIEPVINNRKIYSPRGAERLGYVFVGWYLDAACEEAVDVWKYVVTGDVTFYAKWEEGYIISWDANGGSLFNESVYRDTMEKNSKFSFYYNPQRNGYTFDGWYLDEEFTERVDFSTYIISSDVTFYAKWVES